MSRRAIDVRFFDHPGYSTLHDAWGEVFSKDATGEFVLAPDNALRLLMRARAVAVTEADPDKVGQLESVACRQVQGLNFDLEEALHA